MTSDPTGNDLERFECGVDFGVESGYFVRVSVRRDDGGFEWLSLSVDEADQLAARLREAAATVRIPIVPIDFNGVVSPDYVALDTLGVDWGLDRLGLRIREGLRLRGYDFDAGNGKPDNLVTEGTVELWPEHGSHKDLWVLHMDYLKHQSELGSPDHWSLTTDLEALDREIRDWGRVHSQSGHTAHKYARKD